MQVCMSFTSLHCEELFTKLFMFCNSNCFLFLILVCKYAFLTKAFFCFCTFTQQTQTYTYKQMYCIALMFITIMYKMRCPYWSSNWFFYTILLIKKIKCVEKYLKPRKNEYLLSVSGTIVTLESIFSFQMRYCL